MDNIELFKHPFLNKLTRTNSYFVISVYVIISLSVFTFGVFEHGKSLLNMAASFLGGLLLFSLAEYVFHRYLYHSGENYLDNKNWQFKIHGVHHTVPREKNFLAMPLPLALFIAALLFGVFLLGFGEHVYFIFPGFLIGYALYLFIHYKIHISSPPNNFFKYLWVHHHVHHHLHDETAFGVSSPLWDYIFRTMPPKKK